MGGWDAPPLSRVPYRGPWRPLSVGDGAVAAREAERFVPLRELVQPSLQTVYVCPQAAVRGGPVLEVVLVLAERRVQVVDGRAVSGVWDHVWLPVVGTLPGDLFAKAGVLFSQTLLSHNAGVTLSGVGGEGTWWRALTAISLSISLASASTSATAVSSASIMGAGRLLEADLCTRLRDSRLAAAPV